MTGPDAKWRKRTLWTLLEAAQICAGREPQEHSVVGDEPDAVFRGIGVVTARKLAEELYARSKDAVDLRKLEDYGTRTGYWGNTRVRPYDYIQWARGAGFAIEIEVPVPDAPSAAKPKSPHRSRQRDQEKEILALLKDRGHNPNQLVRVTRGRPGAKAEIAAAVLKKGVNFSSKGQFTKAWDRLLHFKEIRYVEHPGRTKPPPRV